MLDDLTVGGDGKESSPAVKQSVVGKLLVPPSAGSFFVISDAWPSLAIALKSLQVKDVTIVLIGDDAMAVGQWLQANMIGMFVIKLGLDELPVVLRRGEVISAGFIQVQSSLVHVCFEAVTALRDSFPIFTINAKRPPTRDGGIPTRLIHKRCGGVTSGRWWMSGIDRFGLRFKLSLTADSGVTRNLQHVLRSTEGGVSCSGPTSLSRLKRRRGESKIYLPSEHAPVGEIKVGVIAPSVFSRSGFVRRYLSLEELCDVYDLQVNIAKLVIHKPTLCNEKEVISLIANSVPEKVAHRLIHLILLEQAGLEDSATNSPADTSSNDKPDKIAWLEVEKEEELNDEKAARDDDLEADSSQWDEYIMNHYNSKMEWDEMWHRGLCEKCSFTNKPLICFGGIVTKAHKHLFEVLRCLLLQRNKRWVTRSFRKYLRITHGVDWSDHLAQSRKVSIKVHQSFKRKRNSQNTEDRMKQLLIDVEVGASAVKRYANSTWWEWADGSSPLYWRWHPCQMDIVKNGFPVHTMSSFPPYRDKQVWPSDPMHLNKIKEKLKKVIKRGYIAKGPVVSLTSFFAVPKGVSDIRIVYDASRCGFNNTIWAPTFFLPTIDCTLRQVPFGGYMSDIDLGEMFLNFPLGEEAQKYVGIDVTLLQSELENEGLIETKSNISGQAKDRGRLFLRWTRCLMGLKCSPYNAVKGFAWAEEFIRGNLTDPFNPFHVSEVKENLPGSRCYNPAQPRVFRWNGHFNCMSGHFEVYIDDIRCSHPTYRGCVKVARQVAARANYLGIQDAARKRRFPSRNPGVWSGAKSIVTETKVFTSTTQEKWDKGKSIINSWIKEAEESGSLDFKSVETGRGFLVHLGRTYPMMVPNFKGVHHLLESWRGGRDNDGWRLSTSDWKHLVENIQHGKEDKADHLDWKELRDSIKETESMGVRPKRLKVSKVARFMDDLYMLRSFFSSNKPPRRLVRGSQIILVRYGFGDASGGGFGSTWQSGDGINYRYGVWGRDTQGKSSNYRELSNLVETLEQVAKRGELQGVVVYLLTDNSTAERSFHKGTSTSKLLHELVHCLRKLEMDEGCSIHLIHVSGKRMISQGTDGLSRGNLGEGVMRGLEMESFIPLHLSALERLPHVLKCWLRSWMETDMSEGEVEFLSSKDWYTRGHDHYGGTVNIDGYWMPRFKVGTFVWAPAPASAGIALEEIRKARLKRNESTHLFVCPRLMEMEWRKHLNKSADLVFEIPPVFTFWPSNMFEPLVVGLYFPYLKHSPWHLKGSPAMLGLGRRLQSLWKKGEDPTRSVLLQLWSTSRSLQNLPSKLVFKMLRSESQYYISH